MCLVSYIGSQISLCVDHCGGSFTTLRGLPRSSWLGSDRLAEVCVELGLGLLSQSLAGQGPVCFTDHVDCGVIVVLAARYEELVFLQGQQCCVELLSCRITYLGVLVVEKEEQAAQSLDAKLFVLVAEHISEDTNGAHELDDVLRLVALRYCEGMDLFQVGAQLILR